MADGQTASEAESVDFAAGGEGEPFSLSLLLHRHLVYVPPGPGLHPPRGGENSIERQNKEEKRSKPDSLISRPLQSSPSEGILKGSAENGAGRDGAIRREQRRVAFGADKAAEGEVMSAK